jgi:hypothetical protein
VPKFHVVYDAKDAVPTFDQDEVQARGANCHRYDRGIAILSSIRQAGNTPVMFRAQRNMGTAVAQL